MLTCVFCQIITVNLLGHFRLLYCPPKHKFMPMCVFCLSDHFRQLYCPPTHIVMCVVCLSVRSFQMAMPLTRTQTLTNMCFLSVCLSVHFRWLCRPPKQPDGPRVPAATSHRQCSSLSAQVMLPPAVSSGEQEDSQAHRLLPWLSCVQWHGQGWRVPETAGHSTRTHKDHCDRHGGRWGGAGLRWRRQSQGQVTHGGEKPHLFQNHNCLMVGSGHSGTFPSLLRSSLCDKWSVFRAAVAKHYWCGYGIIE